MGPVIPPPKIRTSIAPLVFRPVVRGGVDNGPFGRASAGVDLPQKLLRN